MCVLLSADIMVNSRRGLRYTTAVFCGELSQMDECNFGTGSRDVKRWSGRPNGFFLLNLQQVLTFWGYHCVSCPEFVGTMVHLDKMTHVGTF